MRELDLVHAGHRVDYLRQVCAESIFLRFNERRREKRGRGGEEEGEGVVEIWGSGLMRVVEYIVCGG